jgi:chorismate lyase / 3-hydroxybenzoate synthase
LPADTQAGAAHLHISLGKCLVAPSAEHQLLVAFKFGPDSDDSSRPGVVNTGLMPLHPDSPESGPRYEGWWYRGEVTHRAVGQVRIASCADYAVAFHQVADTEPEQFQQVTQAAYREILQAIATTNHPDIVKIWNYFGDITRGDGDQEKYRQFSIGRATAFDNYCDVEQVIPTGTAIGTVASDRFTIVSLSTSQDFRAAENPRQVSAFEYPRQYGPRSPKFSRGGSVTSPDTRLFIVSGTAAIVGHESLHPDDIELQLEETFCNLDLLSNAISALHGNSTPMAWASDSVLRVYLKHPDDIEFVREQLLQKIGTGASRISFLHADICRRELLVEIDGARILDNPA